MENGFIKVRGAKEHNLKNLNLDIPKGKFVVISGPSGSGKSSLAFDVIFKEGQRRYIESLSPYLRQFLGAYERPNVDRIEGLSPSIAIEQKTVSANPRSTVGTITEIYDFMRVLWASVGKPTCIHCGRVLEGLSASQIVDRVLERAKDKKIMVLAPLVRGRKGDHKMLINKLLKEGYSRVKVNGKLLKLIEVPDLNKNKKHYIDLVLDRFILDEEERGRLLSAIEKSFQMSGGLVKVEYVEEGKEETFSKERFCPEHNFSVPDINPRLFSFNSPEGACKDCNGLGVKMELDESLMVDEEKPVYSFLKVSDLFYRIKNRAVILCRLMGYSPSRKFKSLPKEVREKILKETLEYLKAKYLREDAPKRQREELAKYLRKRECPTCKGARLNERALSVLVAGKNIYEVSSLNLRDCYEFFNSLEKSLREREREVAKDLLKEIKKRLSLLLKLGLDYLTLSRNADTLSGGESQRVRLATQLGLGLSGVIYVLDEPSIGLHPRDVNRLIETLRSLRDLGNTVIVVEHDPETIKSADYVIELGPKGGKEGGYVISEGSVEDLLNNQRSLTGAYLSGRLRVELRKERRRPEKGFMRIVGAKKFNLKNITVEIPKGLFVCITGVSGSGKSTLLYEVLYKYAIGEKVEGVERVEGLEDLEGVISIDQSPIGKTPRSNPATYTKILDPIRQLFAQTPLARARGYSAGWFSFNSVGACEVCGGEGYIKVEMYFLPTAYVLCEACNGSRFKREVLQVYFKGKNIADVLNMTVDEAYEFFQNYPSIRRRLSLLREVGLGYLTLGQPATTLSGGESQRLKIVRELSKKTKGNTLYLLDEPTTGLHMDEVKRLLKVLQRLVDMGNTVVVIEHNLDFIKNADYIIDLGPEGGERGGEVVAVGTPEEVAKCPNSYTGKFLRKVLQS